MYTGSICDISGIKVGHYTDEKNMTGCTVVLCEAGATCGVDVRGSAPGTRETDLMRTGNSVQQAHAICLSGGSAYGLEAACGVMRFLGNKGVGLKVPVGVVPIVGGAVLYDLEVGENVYPDVAAGIAACEAATDQPDFGMVGAGTGATVGKLAGKSQRGGIGSASIKVGDVTVAAVIAVNAVGNVYDFKTGKIIAGATYDSGAFIDFIDMSMGDMSMHELLGKNTTIGVVATDAALTKEQANKLAAVAHDGLAISIRPVHTMFDGDTIFALATGEKQGDFNRILIAAAEVTARAIVNAVSYK